MNLPQKADSAAGFSRGAPHGAPLANDPTGASRIVIGIGELAVSADTRSVLVTHALGSCVAVCLWDPASHVAGMLHYLLPDSRVNPVRAQQQPATFADLGIPQLFQEAYRLGAVKARLIVKLVGGADVTGVQGQGLLEVGRRNQVAAKNLLWRNGVLIKAERLGGCEPRNVTLSVADGSLRITSANQLVANL
ncbi:MAG: chemotaxis protein CheD [Vicinamibacterales bacterium]|nr:chemotaxis protein CheD [Vicinamibacterales bacterium]